MNPGLDSSVYNSTCANGKGGGVRGVGAYIDRVYRRDTLWVALSGDFDFSILLH